MRAGLVRNVFVVVTAVLALGTLELVASAAGKPVLYGGGQALSVAHWPPNCPTSEVECLLIDIRCVDYDIDSACFNVCTGLCTAPMSERIMSNRIVADSAISMTIMAPVLVVTPAPHAAPMMAKCGP